MFPSRYQVSNVPGFPQKGMDGVPAVYTVEVNAAAVRSGGDVDWSMGGGVVAGSMAESMSRSKVSVGENISLSVKTFSRGMTRS